MGQRQQLPHPAADGTRLRGGIVQQALNQSSQFRFPEVFTAVGGNGCIALHQLEKLFIAQAARNEFRSGTNIFTTAPSQQGGHTNHTSRLKFDEGAQATVLFTKQTGTPRFDQKYLTRNEATFAERLSQLVALRLTELAELGTQGSEPA